ncbi:hypothetical protein SELR_pSRC400150 (plasmid) [Selenomonas ruminantium subsp. lactilytica TAM6421]|uniref:Uncharacterized protein n=1 Tax=Selenomonas ruminantium subsp. lactilytica (strain NBRC 103574 / TAM6421) TaxID=927704 RepID=I0GV79_SELRL|nr:hypothetical protein [Selenomonas ruminantium]BAL84666.1 hypothetical protein SELR_pSRC400150 [Selenomonas ruminantium subsp. lactilytica TAM6421]
MKKSVLKVWESKETIMKLGNHAVTIKPRPLPVTIIADKDLEAETFEATRVFYFFEHPICVVNDNAKTFRLSHAGIYATDKATGEVKEGEWPKTTTQTLMMYRDLACGEGYTEIEPIEGRPARDWKTHMEQYQKEKEMRKAGIIPPRKTRTRKAKINEAMLDLLEKEFGLSREAILAKMAQKEQNEPTAPVPNLPMCLPVYTCTAEMVHDWFVSYDKRSQYGVNIDGEHADEAWWLENLPTEDKTEEPEVVVIDADYIEKLQAEAKEIEKKNTSPKTKKKTTTKKTTAKKSTTKKAATKKTTAKKKEAVA